MVGRWGVVRQMARQLNAAAEGIIDFDCVAEAHQIPSAVPQDVVSREGHAWILADLARDPQEAAAAELAEGLSGAMAAGR